MISEFSLFVFTTLAGAAAGGYAVRAVFPLDAQRRRPWLFACVCLALLAISGVALLVHLGRPERVLLAFCNLGAGIAQEGVATLLFGAAVVADLVFCAVRGASPRWLDAVAGVLGLVLACVMGLAYVANVGTPAWTGAGTVPLFLLGDMLMGAGLCAVFNARALEAKAFVWGLAAVAVLAAVTMAVVAAHFAGLGFSAVPFIVGAIAAIGAAAIALIAARGGKAWEPWALCRLRRRGRGGCPVGVLRRSGAVNGCVQARCWETSAALCAFLARSRV
ncbi:DmsC/YnfH family molybdoenzyme membrane anchor subunit [uncultured Senegalimassilia sp.]|uniref:DmsC/YnfH family molybdoenzyme membrane anchor subunit n=1 Tax=uncultured Senegalimassilia sp. TaxID=1714350 RepID=UPI0025F66D6F|nr:DmsC/YnfH family molybdoenzyme membrane anchor subunit [uncultured Senegalimassilia sp.]